MYIGVKLCYNECMNNNEPLTVATLIDMLQHLPETATVFLEVRGEIVPAFGLDVEENDEFLEVTIQDV